MFRSSPIFLSRGVDVKHTRLSVIESSTCVVVGGGGVCVCGCV